MSATSRIGSRGRYKGWRVITPLRHHQCVTTPRSGYTPGVTVYGLHASHEQIHPTELLKAVTCAEQAGFGAVMSSDHFSPWSEQQGQLAFAWSWLGAALQAISLPFGVVNAPSQCYRPALIAQAIGTLAAMYPGRLWAALGNARLRECVDVIRALLAGEQVSHDGLVRVDRARLWSRGCGPVRSKSPRWLARR
jgi:alkanesulfonate monooxygenase SsuD/methylene tetrahydromethanopterin reductase-like flavin-dependent oxidoreductase (luciferase family)